MQEQEPNWNQPRWGGKEGWERGGEKQKDRTGDLWCILLWREARSRMENKRRWVNKFITTKRKLDLSGGSWSPNLEASQLRILCTGIPSSNRCLVWRQNGASMPRQWKLPHLPAPNKPLRTSALLKLIQKSTWRTALLLPFHPEQPHYSLWSGEGKCFSKYM